mgnify:CR=1 FL=1
MLRLAVDENFQGHIIHGLLRRQPRLDIVRVQDVGLAGAGDSVILAWAAEEGRVLLTHDGSTIPPFAYDRLRAGLPMPGVFEVALDIPLAVAIEDLSLIHI